MNQIIVVTKDGKEITFPQDFVFFEDVKSDSLVFYKDFIKEIKSEWRFRVDEVELIVKGGKVIWPKW